MAGAGFSSSQPLIPIFNEPIQEEEERLKETKSKDAKALFILQQAVHETIFSRIAAATTLNEVWSILQTEFQGGSKNEEKAFQVKETTNKYGESYNSTTNSRGRRGFHNRGRGGFYSRGRGSSYGNRRSGIQCYHYSGCSNYVTGTKSLFQELDETQKIHVQLGNKKKMQVEGKGTVGINDDHGKVLNNVQFIPELGYNLLSVGQLMAGGCSLMEKEEAVDTSLATDSSTTATNASVSATPSRDPPSSTALEESSEETPLRTYRSLTDIHASCPFALTVSDPIHYEEAVEREEW
ncbi:hypothetical protein V6N12_013464 [Hibiscus sabdariffa]|uniref:Retrovirus-related Pol polyprotein from transposon TNT 1-94-like beta-barrel domain-containing protein n=1 Tax=Hibiscus sabdariffa TaxID=183260 RepID=A0ABR2BJE0_9ROSI